MFGLEALIAPLSVDQFLAENWNRKAVYIPADESKFADLFGWDDVNGIVNNSGSSFGNLRLVYEKQGLPHAEFKNLAGWLTKGATLGINGVNTIDPVVGRFADLLAKDLNTSVNINCYVSCPSKQAFDIHFDEHDVFAVQLAGEKKWRVFEPTLEHPLHVQNLKHGDRSSIGAPPDSGPYITCDMTPGDVLYLPRGHWHYALAASPSIHFAVGPSSRSGVEFLSWLTQQVMNHEPLFRKDFPLAGSAIFEGGEPETALLDHLEALRTRIGELLADEVFCEGLIRYSMGSNPARPNHQLPETWTVLDGFDQDTRFQVVPTQKFVTRFDERTAHAQVHSRGQLIEIEGATPGLLVRVFETPGATFSGADLLRENPSIPWKRLRPTLESLFQQGLLILAD